MHSRQDLHKSCPQCRIRKKPSRAYTVSHLAKTKSNHQTEYRLPKPKKGLPIILAVGDNSPVGRRCRSGSNWSGLAQSRDIALREWLRNRIGGYPVPAYHALKITIAPIAQIRILAVVNINCTFWYMKTLIYIIRGRSVGDTCEDHVGRRRQKKVQV